VLGRSQALDGTGGRTTDDDSLSTLTIHTDLPSPIHFSAYFCSWVRSENRR
jgi:hypothetical protein